MTDIIWTNTTVSLDKLQPWAGNPKRSTKKHQAQLATSFDELGQFATIAIGPDGEVYDGHQRLSALLAQHGKGYQVEARQSSRPLTEQERRKVSIYSRQIGAWDWDVLNAWEPDELSAWGFDGDALREWNLDVMNLREMLESEGVLGNDPNEEWEGMPDFEQNEIKVYRTIKVHFKTEDDYKLFASIIGQELTDKTISIYYPKQNDEDLKKYRVFDES